MSNVDTRQLSRDSLFVMAKVRIDGDPNGKEHPVKVRNLSPAGLMAEGNVKVSVGVQVGIELRNVGWVEGTVAWKQDDRFGIAFHEDIDHRQVRVAPGSGDPDIDTARYVRPGPKTGHPETSKLRKI